MRVHLTELAVRALRPRPGKQFKAWDSSTVGFGALVGERTPTETGLATYAKLSVKSSAD